MKKIINNKLYNTDTANRLIYWYNDLPSNDIYYYAEELYIKKTGEYFLYGEGGARSPYGSYDCEERCSYPDWSIIPLTEAKAKEWAVGHCSADKYMELFGAVAEQFVKGCRFWRHPFILHFPFSIASLFPACQGTHFAYHPFNQSTNTKRMSVFPTTKKIDHFLQISKSILHI